MSGFVVRRQAALLFFHHHRFALDAEHHFVLCVLQIHHVDAIMVATDGKQCGLVHQIREIGTRHARRAARHRRDVDIVRDRLVA